MKGEFVNTKARRINLIWIGAIIAILGTITARRIHVAAADIQPTNSLPDPYRTIENWAKLPEGRAWGSTAGVTVDRKGNIWVAERCAANSCAGSNLAPILEFDPSGKLLTSFGAGMFIFPHGITADRDGNIWVTDGDGKDGKGHQVFKFSPKGKVLLTLGKAGVAGDGEDTFNKPSAVAIAANGDIFVADGHGGNSNARIVKFSKDGKFIMTWGTKGSAPGELNIPHALAFDSKGRLFVADRGNNRIQIFDQNGKFIDQWQQFSRPSGIFIDQNDVIYVADSESGSVAKDRGAWKRGIRVGSAKDGSLSAFIPDPNADPNYTGTSAAEGVAADSKGVIYGAEVGPKDLKKYVKQ
jgi:DNA-binding beta-propeller fold protein YncE